MYRNNIWEDNILSWDSEGSVEKKISGKEYNNRMVYDYYNNLFLADFGSPDLNISPITIDDSNHPDKRSLYIPGLLSAAIFVAYKNSVSTLTNPSSLPQLLILTSDYPNPHHAMKSRQRDEEIYK